MNAITIIACILSLVLFILWLLMVLAIDSIRVNMIEVVKRMDATQKNFDLVLYELRKFRTKQEQKGVGNAV